MDAQRITLRMKGQWYSAGYGTVRCPCHEDDHPSLRLRDGDSRLLVACYAGCEPYVILAELRRQGLLGERECDGSGPIAVLDHKPKGPKIDRHEDCARAIWAECQPISGTLAERYLNSRGLTLPPDVSDLQFHPACPRGPERLPAMVARFRDIHSNEPRGLHRTFLTDAATKVAGNAKMMLGRTAGAAIKLCSDDVVNDGLHIAEGIETGLALLNFGFAPIWIPGNAGALGSFPVLPGIDAISIAVDEDQRGRATATACAARWRAAGREVRFIRAIAEGADIASLAERYA